MVWSGESSEIVTLDNSDCDLVSCPESVSDRGNPKTRVRVRELANSATSLSDNESLKSDECVKTAEGTLNISDAERTPDSSNLVEAGRRMVWAKSADSAK
jgi:hypothetical protein